MGILDSKTRIMDSIITQEGKRQIASGRLKAEFYSFSDTGAIYNLSDTFVSGTNCLTDDIATKFLFEPTNQTQDQVTFEANDSGKLVVKELKTISGNAIRVLNGHVLSGTIGSTFQIVTASAAFASLAQELLTSSIDNFTNLQIIGSPDLINDATAKFELSNKTINWEITDEAPIPSQLNNNGSGTQEANINNIESLFADKRLSHLPNYQFLPPVNKPKKNVNTVYPIGVYIKIEQPPLLTYKDVLDEININSFKEDINFTYTSSDSKIIGQFFEIAGDQVSKLDIIDFGHFASETTVNGFSNTNHVFFVGKVFIDDNGSQTFVNMFTLILS